MIRILALLALLAAANAAGLYDTSKSPVGILNKNNFNHQIKKMNLEHVKIVEFYAPWCGHCKSLAPEWESLAKDMKGIVKVYAVDCDENADLCKEQDVSGFPTIKVFPPDLLGVQIYNGERTKKDITRFATNFVNNFVTQVKSDSEAAFLNKDKAMAKVLLFTDKPKTPLLYKGLSVEFKNKLMLGMIKSEDKALCTKYRVTKFPTVLVLIAGQQKPLKYEGKMEFQPLFDYLNRYQETFAMKENVEDEAADKPWLSQTIPELTSLSADDVCYRFDGVCVVTVAKAADNKLPANVQDTLTAVKAKFERQINRGTKFSFVWVNSAVEKDFAAGVGAADDATHFVALKLGKRNRYAPLEGAFDESNISTFLDRVMGGDAKYSPLNPIPALTPREKPNKAKK